MTSTTKAGIVEHVARSMHVAVSFDPDDWHPRHPKNATEAGYYESEFAAARAAIRATLEYARDHVSEAAIDAGVNYRLSTTLGGENTWPTDTAALFRAMIATLIEEMEAQHGL